MQNKDISERLISGDECVRENKKNGSYLKTAAVLALFGGMAAVYANMGKSTAT